MKRTKYLAVALVIFMVYATVSAPILPATSNNQQVISSGSYDKGYRYNIQGWVYIHIEGDPYERGYQYGYLATAEIIDMINRWSEFGAGKKIYAIYTVKTPQDWWEICKNKAIKTFWKNYPEEYKEEIKGIADGAKDRGGKVFGVPVSYQDIFTISQMQEVTVMLQKFYRGIHPVRDILFGIKLLRNGDAVNQESGRCSAFLATGDATPDGRIVAAHTSQFAYYITERCNIILDVEPSEGHRFLMTAPPGQIWSNEDYFQNDAGIILLETCPGASRVWTKNGISWAVRARQAIQYSDSIDDVLRILKTGNNGMYASEWLIGDTKTGEIASLEIAFLRSAVKRTFNGFYWSCTMIQDPLVKRELYGIIGLFPLSSRLQSKSTHGRDKVFTELGEKYYGQFDTEIAKEIMSLYPLCIRSNDAKVTDSVLMKDLGLYAFGGVPNGTQWNPDDQEIKKYKGIEVFPPSGWLELYGINHNPLLLESNDGMDQEGGKNSKVVWEYETDDHRNMVYISSAVSKDMLYTATSTGTVYALNADQGTMMWEQHVGEKAIDAVQTGTLLIVGTDRGLCALDKKTGNTKWEQNKGEVTSKPTIVNGIVLCSFANGKLSAFRVDSGEYEWTYSFSDVSYISDVQKDIIYACSKDTCYALDVENKKIAWTFQTGGEITAPPRVFDNTVCFGSWDGNLYALDATDGNLLWKYETGWGIDTTPLISNGMVFVGSNDNRFYAFNEKTGELLWFFTCKAAVHSSSAIYGEYVFFGSDDGRFYALNKTDGGLAWDFAPGFVIEEDNANNFKTTPILSNPLVENGIVYVGAKGTVYALDAQTVEEPLQTVKEEAIIQPVMVFILLGCLGIGLIVISLLIAINNKRRGGR